MKTDNFFVKAHGLGNEYIILQQERFNFQLTKHNIGLICNIHFGIGSDGILLHTPSVKADFGLRIFNPDGSEAEKSGNGLRIFCKYLFDYGFSKNKHFTVETLGGVVNAIINKEANGRATLVTIEMGKAIFTSKEIPVLCPNNECIDYELVANGKKFIINCVSVGNPHCIIFVDALNEELVKEYGPFIENHSMFPNRINTQFVKVINRNEVEILIWERGAGYTMASGSSSSAVVSMCRKKGLVDNDVTVHMQGGDLKIIVDNDFNISLCGEVKQVAEGYLCGEILDELTANS